MLIYVQQVLEIQLFIIPKERKSIFQEVTEKNFWALSSKFLMCKILCKVQLVSKNDYSGGEKGGEELIEGGGDCKTFTC